MPIIVPEPPRSDPQVDIAIELEYQRNLTTWFIEFEPLDVVLIPRLRTRTASGGSTYADLPPRRVQRMRLIRMSSAQKPLVTQDGRERIIDFTLMGQWDAEMAVGDHWRDLEGLLYEVVELVPSNGYERKALVVKHGHG